MQFDFGDSTFRLRNCSRELTLFAFETIGFALQLGKARNRNQIFLPELSYRAEFAADQLDFGCFGILLTCETARFLAQLRNAFAELRALSLPCGTAQLEQALFAVQDFSDIRIVFALQ